jgi:predicted nucleic acid-binding protein
MGKLTRSLSNCRVIGLDTPVFIYHLEKHETYARLTSELLGGIEDGLWEGVTSMITLMEITVHPWRARREEVARQYEALLLNFPHLTFAVVDREIARLAAQLRARFDVRPPDALQVAAALARGAPAFVTNDRRLKHLTPLIRIVLLEDFLSST